MQTIPSASGLSHSRQRWGRALISCSLAIKPAASTQAVALNHGGGRPHLSPRVLPFASATKAPAWVTTHSPTPKGWKAELAEAGCYTHNLVTQPTIPVWRGIGKVRQRSNHHVTPQIWFYLRTCLKWAPLNTNYLRTSSTSVTVPSSDMLSPPSEGRDLCLHDDSHLAGPDRERTDETDGDNDKTVSETAAPPCGLVQLNKNTRR